MKRLNMFQTILRRRRGSALAEKGIILAAVVGATTVGSQWFGDRLQTSLKVATDDFDTAAGISGNATWFGYDETTETTVDSESKKNLKEGLNSSGSNVINKSQKERK